VPSARRSQELHQEEFLQDAWLKGEDHDREETEAVKQPGAVSGVEGEGDPA